MLMCPPALLSAQWLFRDITMQELVSEALFPPMPAGGIRSGDQWDVVIPASIPLAAQLDSTIRSRLLTPSERTAPGIIQIEGKGTIAPAKLIIADLEPAIRPTIHRAEHTVSLTVNPETHTLKQESKRKLELGLHLIPPTKSQTLEMKIKQTRELTAIRGKLESPEKQN